MPAVLNAANEVAVAAFLDGKIPFTSIVRLIEDVLANTVRADALTLDAVLGADRAARHRAHGWVERTSSGGRVSAGSGYAHGAS
jgi:1-deoxy-D-xylulose-5-phosphate reductoisomerase